MDIQIVSEGFERTVNVSIPADRVRQELDRAFSALAKSVRLRGFRQGRAPRKVLEAKFGGQVRSDVAGNLIQEGWTDAMSEHGIEPVSRPEITEQSEISGKASFSFTIAVDVKPAVEVATFEGLEVTKPVVEVGDDELEAAMRAKLEGHARLVSVEDRPVQIGDMVMVELTATANGEELANEPGTMIRTESDPYFPGVEVLLEGLAVGGDNTGTVVFPEDARSESIAGKECEVTVKVLAIQANEVPEASDEIALELGFEGGVDGMREGVRAEIAGQREELARNQARANLLEVLIEKNPFGVPDGMVEQNLKMLEDELRFQNALRGVDPRTVTFSEAQRTDLRVRAEFAAKSALILEKVATTQNISVDEADIEARYHELAESRGQTLEAVKGWFQREDAIEDLKERILEEKTLDWLLDRSTLVEAAPEAPAPEEPVEIEETAAAEEDAAE